MDRLSGGFQQLAVLKLQNILCRIPGKKDLIIQPELIKPLENFTSAVWLRSKGVAKIYKFDLNQITVEPDQHVIFFIRSDVEIFLKVLHQIQSLQLRRKQCDEQYIKLFHVIVLPHVDHKYDVILEENGLYGLVELYKFNWDFLTLDVGVLSMEIPKLFEDVFFDKDFSNLASVAHSLRCLDMIIRKPNIVVTLGEKSEKLIQMVDHMEAKRPSVNEENPNKSDFSLMLVMDRSCDFVSCFLTPVIYAGLLLEVHRPNTGTLTSSAEQGNRIQQGKLQWLERKTIPPSVEENKKPTESISLRMNSSVDKTYSDNKYVHFSEVLATLSVQAKALGVEGQTSKNMKIHEMKEYVEKKLPKVAAAKKELMKHLAFSEEIVTELGKHFEVLQQIEENMICGENRKQTLHLIEENFLTISPNRGLALKLAILFHLTFDMNDEEQTQLFRKFFNTFGFENLSIFWKLISANLLPKTILKALPIHQSPIVNQQHKIKAKLLNNLPKFSSQFQVNAAKLKQIPADESQKTKLGKVDSLCPSYVFNRNYIPTLAAVLRAFGEAPNFEEVALKLGHLDHMKVSSKLCPDSAPVSIREMGTMIKNNRFPELFPLKPKTIIVFVLGGLTYAEIAACKAIEKLTDSKIVCFTDSMVSAYDFFDSK